MQTVTIIRNGQSIITLSVDIHSDGSIWARGSAGMQPVVSADKMHAAGISKDQMVKWIKAGRLTEAAECAWRMGVNSSSTEVVTVEEWEGRMAAKRDAEIEIHKYARTIHLSGRGWGDYSPVEWTGDIRRPDTEIIAECRELLDNASDVDEPQADEQIAGKLAQARAALQAELDSQQAHKDRIAALQADAKRTGKPVEIRRWMTHDCMNHSIDCSFDSAVETIDGNGNRKTTYTCCY